MLSEEALNKLHDFIDDHRSEAIDMLDEQMHEYVDDEDVEEYGSAHRFVDTCDLVEDEDRLDVEEVISEHIFE